MKIAGKKSYLQEESEGLILFLFLNMNINYFFCNIQNTNKTAPFYILLELQEISRSICV